MEQLDIIYLYLQIFYNIKNTPEFTTEGPYTELNSGKYRMEITFWKDQLQETTAEKVIDVESIENAWRINDCTFEYKYGMPQLKEVPVSFEGILLFLLMLQAPTQPGNYCKEAPSVNPIREDPSIHSMLFSTQAISPELTQIEAHKSISRDSDIIKGYSGVYLIKSGYLQSFEVRILETNFQVTVKFNPKDN